jgi:hypothetical protein
MRGPLLLVLLAVSNQKIGCLEIELTKELRHRARPVGIVLTVTNSAPLKFEGDALTDIFITEIEKVVLIAVVSFSGKY